MDYQHIDANRQRLYVALDGPPDGPLVVLLHGFPETSRAWHVHMRSLAAAGLRVVAPDQRGYGHSSKPAGVRAYALDLLADDVVALARALGRDSARIVGHDWGGLVAWVLAAREDGFVERMAILNAPHPATLLPEMLRHPSQALRSSYIALFQLPWVAEAVIGGFQRRVLERSLTSTSRPGTFDAEILAAYRRAWSSKRALTGMLNWYRALHLAPDLDLRAIQPPVRIIWGERDVALNARLADRAMARCVRGELFRLPEASHWLHHEEPARVGQLLLEFLH